MQNSDAVREAAMKELNEEEFRRLVDEEKVKIREKRKYLFPWKISLTITRRS